jgi:O-methyltransferase
MLNAISAAVKRLIATLPEPYRASASEIAAEIYYFGLPLPFRAVRHSTLLSNLNLFFLQELARRADRLGLSGDFVECGVYKGGSAGVLGFEAMRSSIKRNLWLYDAFSGMPPATGMDDDHSRSIEGQYVGSESNTRRILHRLGVKESRYKIVRGWFEDTLPKAEPCRIALLHVDCDFYDPVKLTLETFYPQVEPLGFVVLNDYGSHAGCRAATTEFLEKLTYGVSPIQIDRDAWYFQKPSADS